MKKISVLFVAALVFSTTSLLANDVNPIEPTKAKTLSVQIGEMLKTNSFVLKLGEERSAQVRFTLNTDKEIVVLSVDAEEDGIEAFVKNTLNYKKVDLPVVKEGKIYTVPVKFTR